MLQGARVGHRVKWHGRPLVTAEKQVNRTAPELRGKGACSGWTQDPGYRLCKQKSGQIPALTRPFSQALWASCELYPPARKLTRLVQESVSDNSWSHCRVVCRFPTLGILNSCRHSLASYAAASLDGVLPLLPYLVPTPCRGRPEAKAGTCSPISSLSSASRPVSSLLLPGIGLRRKMRSHTSCLIVHFLGSPG